jgi:electron transport complex protein RnfD
MGLVENLFFDRNDTLIMLFTIPVYFAAIGKYGLRIVVALLISFFIGMMIEIAAFRIRKQAIGILGMPAWIVFPLIFPPVFPLWMIGVSLFFGVVIGIAVFGGHGHALISPVALGWTVALVSFPSAFRLGWSLPFPDVFFGFSRYIAAVLTVEHPLRYIDTRIFRLPNPIVAVFQGNIPQTPGNAISYVVIVCGIVLLLLRATDFRVCLSFIGTVFTLAIGCDYLFPAFSQHFLELFIGNLLLAAFFIIADRRIAPKTKGGRWITGIFTGIVAFLFRYFSPFPEGVFFAILIGNVCSPIIDERILQFRYRHIAQTSISGPKL